MNAPLGPVRVNDWRLPWLAAGAWTGGLIGPVVATSWGWTSIAAVLAVAGGLVVVAGIQRRGLVAAVAGCVLVVAAASGLRTTQAHHNPVVDLAQAGAQVDLVAQVTDDPRISRGRFGDTAVLHAQVTRVTGRGRTFRLRVAVVVLAEPDWVRVRLGSTIAFSGRLSVADGDVAALVDAVGPARQVDSPDLWWRAAGAVRSSVREVVGSRPPDQRALLPALVDGDDIAVSADLADDFATTGLTHLMAVSGTNLTILLAALLALARWSGVRGRWLMVVGALGITGFILVARTEPSVLRAAVMGTIGMVALTVGRVQALRTLSGAVVALILVSPELAHSAGFALSVAATFGIVIWSPPWRDALARWLPGWLAEAIAVPTAAQLACTPLIAALSGKVSLVAVAANMIVEPVVGPATILGLLGGLLGLVWTPLGAVVALPGSWCVGWIALVARRGADLPGAEVGWSTTWWSLVALLGIVAAVVWLGPRVVRRRWIGVAVVLALVVVVAVRVPRWGWPPDGWVLVACDVGQGDGLVLNAGDGNAVVVDSGPDPAAIQSCLDDLGVHRVGLLVLTHLHADHVDGVRGVLAGREVDRVVTTGDLDPPSAAEALADTVAPAVEVAAAGDRFVVGQVLLQALWPADHTVRLGVDGSSANDASVVLLAEVDGVRTLLTGDLEPPGQAAVEAANPGLRVDVLKVPHHGSAYQSIGWLTSLDARIAVVSVGADNDYGHPNPQVLTALSDGGTRVWRTDLDGTVAVVRAGDEITVATAG
ncbi:ComEC/Rec2 family competence protein [soil metagenome]